MAVRARPGPPEDRIKDVFYGGQASFTQQRKMQEMEKKRAYAADLQAQMQEKEQQRQEERIQRFGCAAPSGLQAGSMGQQQAAGMASKGMAAQQEQQQLLGMPVPAACMQQPQQVSYMAPPWQQPLMPAASNQGYQGSGAYYASPTLGMQGIAPQQQQQQFSGLSPGAQSHCCTWTDTNGPGIAAGSPWAGPPATCCSPGSMYAGGMQHPYASMSFGPAATAADGGSSSPAGSCGGLPPPGSYPAAAELEYLRQQQGPVDVGREIPPGMLQSAVGPWGPGPFSAAVQCGYNLSSNHAAGRAAAMEGAWAPAAAAPAGGIGSSNPRALQDKARKDAYRAELEAQIRDKAARKAAEKNALAVAEARKEAEMAAYSPWGRAGAGAPLRDAAGKVVSDLRGGRKAMEQQQQQAFQLQQQQQEVLLQQQQFPSSEQFYGSSASEQQSPPGCWGGPDESTSMSDRYVQQQPAAIAGIGGGAAGSGVPVGAPPLLCFRSDKAFMTATEVENRARAQRELQKELDQQIQEKKQRKELEQQQAALEARREEERLAAEQARLAAQFESEQAKDKAKASVSTGVEEQVAGAWNAAKQAAVNERRKTMERKRSSAHILEEDRGTVLQQQQQQQQQQTLPQQPVQQQQQQQNHDSMTFVGLQDSPHQPGWQQQQHQERQQLMLEALGLEEQKIRQMAAQEVGKLRQDMESQAAALRDMLERQGGQVAALRAVAAAAEAQSTAAKVELAQVKEEFMRRSQELRHETLSTILADCGSGPASSIAAAYHPAPIRTIDLELPPSAADIRRSLHWLQGSTEHGASSFADAACGVGVPSGPSAVELLESMLQQGRQQPPGGFMAGSLEAADAASAEPPGCGRRGRGAAAGRAASLPVAVAAMGTQIAPSWLDGLAVGKGGSNLRGSMLASESTFIFPAGIMPPITAGAGVGEGDYDEPGGQLGHLAGDELEAAASRRIHSSSVLAEEGVGGGAGWGMWQQQPSTWQQPPRQQLTRQTSSAPGGSSSGRAAAGSLQSTLSAGRQGLVTPCGSDLSSLVNKTADRLQLLSTMPPPGDPEALDEFLSKFVSSSSQPHQRTVATPPSRLMTRPTSALLQHTFSGSSSSSRANHPPRLSNAADIATAEDAAVAGAAGIYLGLADTLEQEMSRMGVGVAAAGTISSAAAVTLAQQRLKTTGGNF